MQNLIRKRALGDVVEPFFTLIIGLSDWLEVVRSLLRYAFPVRQCIAFETGQVTRRNANQAMEMKVRISCFR